MARVTWRERITVDPELHHGTPCIKGTRIPVRTIIGSLAGGMAPDETMRAYAQLAEADLQAALAYAAEVIRGRA